MTIPANQAPTGGLTPHITIRDKRAAEAIDFYARAFGATEVVRVPADDGVRLMHAHMHVNGASPMMHDDSPEYSRNPAPAPAGVDLHPQVAHPDRWYRRAAQAGGAGALAPHDNTLARRYSTEWQAHWER